MCWIVSPEGRSILTVCVTPQRKNRHKPDVCLSDRPHVSGTLSGRFSIPPFRFYCSSRPREISAYLAFVKRKNKGEVL